MNIDVKPTTICSAHGGTWLHLWVVLVTKQEFHNGPYTTSLIALREQTRVLTHPENFGYTSQPFKDVSIWISNVLNLADILLDRSTKIPCFPDNFVPVELCYCRLTNCICKHVGNKTASVSSLTLQSILFWLTVQQPPPIHTIRWKVSGPGCTYAGVKLTRLL